MNRLDLRRLVKKISGGLGQSRPHIKYHQGGKEVEQNPKQDKTGIKRFKERERSTLQAYLNKF